MRKIFMVFIFVAFVYASHENIGVSPESRALGESTVSMGLGISGVFSNPAGLMDATNLQVALFYEKPYGAQGIGNINSAFLGIKYTKFAISFSEYYAKLEGDYSGLYSEGIYSLSYAIPFGVLSLGSNLNVYKFQDPRFGTDFTAGLDFGLLTRISDFVSAGICYHNVFRARIRGENLPYYLDAGIRVSVRDLSRSLIAFRMMPSSQVVLMFGEEVDLVKNILTLRGGLSYGNDTRKASLGLSVKAIEKFTISYSFSSNFELSPAHSLGVVYGR
ncbi:MAG: hypothetical protein ACPLN0_00330 [Candidatus Hydrothermia bacterium]